MNSDSLFFFGNVFLGLFAFSLQVTALAVSDATYIPDLVCTGIWGGAFLIMFASLLKTRMLSCKTIKALAVYSMLIGFTLIGLHAWSISSYSDFIDFCEFFLFNNEIGLCGRVAIDSLLICSGSLIVILNVFIASKASSMVKLLA
ncbi:uncharacterized protein LOC130698106 [Daphnia carinata]|uniref:uncharacterized protein LOC130698106 n=1 Tax=Daphnia carinata TaxID=120202 RepID=UPI00257B998B|nr:uncharacterized protein LOC130698106 [Daphnia carinata]